MASVSISDFKITVKLDSGQAMAGLRSLHAKLNAFANRARTSLPVEQAGAVAAKKKAKELGLAARAAKAIYRAFKKLSGFVVKGVMKPFSMIGSMLGDWKWLLLGMVTTAGVLVAKITTAGMAMQRASIAMKAAVGGSDVALGLSPQERARLQSDQLHFAQKLAKTYGMGLTDTVHEYAKFFAASSKYIGVSGTEHLFRSFSKLSVVYGMTAEKQKRAMTAFTQMASKNQVMAEELKQQLGDVLPGSMEIFARAMTKMGKWGTVTVERLYDMMAKGQIIASEVLPAVADEMERMADPTLNEALKSTAVQFSRLKTQAEATGAGIFNQFNKPLGELIMKFTKFLSGEGMQVTIGKTISKVIKDITKTLEPFFTTMEEFEEKWQSLDREGKIKLVKEGSFYSALFEGIKAAVGKAWEELDLEPFKDKMVDALTYVFQTAWDNIKLFSNPFTSLGSDAGIFLSERSEGLRSSRRRQGGNSTGAINSEVTNNITVYGDATKENIDYATSELDKITSNSVPNL